MEEELGWIRQKTGARKALLAECLVRDDARASSKLLGFATWVWQKQRMSSFSDPVTMGVLSLSNRLVMAPLTRCRAGIGRVPNASMVEYYRQRAGAGMIVSEATAISPMGVGYPNTPGLWTPEQIDGWKLVTQAVHKEGGCIVAQLWHVGRISDPVYLDGKLPLAPSAIAAEGHVSLLRPIHPFVTPRALDLSKIPGIIEEYRKAAQNALAAGFDGVELHGANGYLPDQFLHTESNQRTDSYGGSVENRARFLLEALDALISACGEDRVGLHLSPRGGTHSITNQEAEAIYKYVAREAGRRRIAFLFVRETLVEPRLAPMIRHEFGGPIIANELLSKEDGEKLLASGEADAVGYGRLFIANPDLPERFAKGAALNLPDPNTFMVAGTKGYIDYPVFAD